MAYSFFSEAHGRYQHYCICCSHPNTEHMQNQHSLSTLCKEDDPACKQGPDTEGILSAVEAVM